MQIQEEDYDEERSPLLEDTGSVNVEPLEGQKQSSLTTVLALANTMLGSSLLAIPWGFTQSGFAMGLVVVALVGLLCYYTAYLVVLNGQGREDFSDVCRDTLGGWAYYLSVFTSILILLGALVAYDIIMSESLFGFVTGFRHLVHPHTDASASFHRVWTEKTAPLIVIAIVFPFTNLKYITALVKLNTLGVVAIIYLLIYIPFVSIYGRTEDFKFREEKEIDHKFFYLAGILTLAFFIHSLCPSMLKNNRNQKNNARDLFLAYCIVAFCYAVVGGIAYLSYSHQPGGIPQDFLTLLPETHILSMISRGVVVIQLFSVYPLIVYIIRIQFFGLFHKTPSWPGFHWVLLMNVLLATFSTVFAVFYPHIGNILRFTGAFCGFIYVFLLPIGVHWVTQKRNRELGPVSLVFHGFLLLIGLGSIVAQLV